MIREWGTPTRRQDGHLGARAFVKFSHKGWDAHHHVDSHGHSSSSLAAHVSSLEEQHRVWAEAIDDLQRYTNYTFIYRGNRYHIVDCTIPSRTSPPWELVIGLRRDANYPILGTEPDFQKVEGSPIRVRLASLSEIPNRHAIEDIVFAHIRNLHGVSDAHAEFQAKVKARIR
jgi:hypothetical protein